MTNKIVPTIFAAFALIAFAHIKSGQPLNATWLAAYALFCGPSILLWITSIISTSGSSVQKPFAIISLFFVLLWVYMIAKNDGYLVMPATAFTLLVIAVVAFLFAVLNRLVLYVKNGIHRR